MNAGGQAAERWTRTWKEQSARWHISTRSLHRKFL